jgi:syntaxin 18
MSYESWTSYTDGQHVHLESLTALLQTIRKPYLSITEPPISRRQRPQASGSQADDDLSRWKGSTYLSDRERDEIDLRGRMILRRCKERLYDLERSEKGQSPSRELWTKRG